MGNCCSKIIKEEEDNTMGNEEIEILIDSNVTDNENKIQHLKKEPSSPLFEKVNEDFDQNISKLGNRSITSSSSNINSNDVDNISKNNTFVLEEISEEFDNRISNNINKEIGEKEMTTLQEHLTNIVEINKSIKNPKVGEKLPDEQIDKYRGFLNYKLELIDKLQNDKIVQSSKGLKRSMELLVKGNDYGLSPEDYITGKQQAKIFLDRIIVANDSDYKEETNRAKIIKQLAICIEQAKLIDEKFPYVKKDTENKFNIITEQVDDNINNNKHIRTYSSPISPTA